MRNNDIYTHIIHHSTSAAAANAYKNNSSRSKMQPTTLVCGFVYDWRINYFFPLISFLSPNGIIVIRFFSFHEQRNSIITIIFYNYQSECLSLWRLASVPQPTTRKQSFTLKRLISFFMLRLLLFRMKSRNNHLLVFPKRDSLHFFSNKERGREREKRSQTGR